MISCQQNSIKFNEVILDNDIINSVFLQNINEPEKALLSGYLFAYGNECVPSSTSAKCKILKELKLENECEEQHKVFINKWFKKVVLMKHKLQKCPNLPLTFAIQNTFEKIVMSRVSDTITITFRIKGINESQEKNWDLEQTDSYFINEGVFKKVN